MKKIKIVFTGLLLIMMGAGCSDEFIDLEPRDFVSESVFFKTPEHFDEAANDLYFGLIPFWEDDYYTDHGSDLSALAQETGRGTNVIAAEDSYWTDGYENLRDVNVLLTKADEYEGNQEDISVPVGTAYFFRAYQHFKLLERFGGVPIVTEVVDFDTPLLYGQRNSRYEVVAQILSDLDAAIPLLPQEAGIDSNDKGKISSNAAQAFKARVLLYEATWEKYNGTSTDDQLTMVPDGYPSIDAMLTESIALSKEVMDHGVYELWNYNDDLNNLNHYFLFNLEGGESNPANLDKSSNREFIIQIVYDFVERQSGEALSRAAGGRRTPSRKFLDMFLCDDGLPIDKSPRFQGYATLSDEFTNRDFRMHAYFDNIPNGTSPALSTPVAFASPGIGIEGRKFHSYLYPADRQDEEESFNCPELRLAEVYLNYAEALFELNGAISDEELDESLNLVRERSGVAGLTNSMVSANGLDMLEEIRRERAIELFSENSRFFDLKRWGIAEEELGTTVYGPVIEGTVYETDQSLYDPTNFFNGTEDAIVGDGSSRETLILDPSINRIFSKKNYLFPIPTSQIQLNPNLAQNPGW